MKKIIIVFSILVAIGLASIAGPVFAAGVHDPVFQVKLSSDPMFPVVGQEATLTFEIANMAGEPLAGQDVMVMLNKNETGGHAHEGEAEQAEAPAGGHDMANMGGEEEEVPTIHVMPKEVSPGIYEEKITFEHGGRYVATVNLMGEEVDVVLGVRSSPVAWWFVGGLAGLVTLLAGAVAVTKTARRAW